MKWWAAVALTWLAQLAALGPARAQEPVRDPERAPPALRQALEALEAGDPQRAVDLLEPFADRSETPPQVLSLLGFLYLETDRPREALEILAPLTRIEPPQPAVLYHAGRAALAVGEADRAREYFERSIELEPGTPAARELGMLLGRDGRIVEAYRLLKPWAEAHPEDKEARLAAALAALRLRRLPEAERFLSDLPQDEPNVRLLWGRLLLQRGEPYAAIATLRPLAEAKEGGRATRDAIGTLADAYLAVGESGKAVTLLRQVAGVQEDAMLALKLGQALYQGGELDEALGVLAPHAEAMLESEQAGQPVAAGLAREYGRILAAAGRPRQAIPHLRLAVRHEPEAKEGWQALGQALAATGATEEAREALERFQELAEARGPATARRDRLRQDREDPTGRQVRLAGELAAAGETARALEILETEMALVPDDLRPRLMASHIHLVGGRLEEALAVAQSAVKAAPENADGHYQLGAVHLAKEDLDAAERHLRRALELSPTHTAAMNDLAVLLMVRGRREEARELLQRVLEIRPDDEQARRNLQELEGGA